MSKKPNYEAAHENRSEIYYGLVIKSNQVLVQKWFIRICTFTLTHDNYFNT